MSKFKKILVVTLLLALTVTAFAVVSLAAGEPQAVHVGGHKTDTTFETFTAGSVPFTRTGNAGTNGGIFIGEAYPGGNKYLEIIGSTGSNAESRYSTFISDDYGRRTTYTLGNYPIVAIDFDIMTPDGDWGLGTNLGNSAGLYIRPYVGSAMQGSLFNDVVYGDLPLPKEAYLWHHLTLVFELTYDNYGESLVKQSIYINGELAKEYTTINMTTKYPTIDATKLFLGPIYFRTSRYRTVNHQAIDNIKFTYFEEGYDIKSVPTYVYNEFYEMPFGEPIAKIGTEYYDSIPKAIDAAKSGDVIRLVGDVEQVINVNKTVILDTNKYDELGKPTGEHYKIQTSSNTLVSKTEGGLITFKQVQNASMQIYWDDCPGAAAGGKCTCPKIYLDENGEHMMSEFTPYAMLNSVPLYPGQTPTFPIVNGVEKRFVGWSLEQGGEPITLTPITSEQISDGWLSLYPVYEEYTYGFEVIDKNGNSSFYASDTAEDVVIVFSKAPAGSTIKLHDDVIAPGITLSEKDLTLDLNGYSYLNLVTKLVRYEVTYDESSGAYTKGEEPVALETIVTSEVTGAGLFSANKSNFTFTIKSSRPGSVMAPMSLISEEWVCGGAVVKTIDLAKVVGRRLLYAHPSSATFNIYGENITFYADEFFVSTHGSNTAKLSLNVDGGTFCYIPEEKSDVCGLFSIRTGGTHYIKNATIYANGDFLFRNTIGDRDRNTKMVYENCNIYNAKIGTSYANDTHIFENCRLDLSSVQGTVILGYNNYVTKSLSKYTYDEGTELQALATAESYNFYSPVADYTGIIDRTTGRPITLPGTAYKTVAFAYKTYNPLYAPTEVTFKDFDGNVIATVTANQNKPITPPAVAVDGYRVVTNAIWINEADGTELGETLGSETSYTFKATLPANPEYKANLSVVMMNMSYYNGFAYNIYLPKTDDAEFISVCGEALSGDIVLIDGKPYYLYTVSVAPDKALDDFIAKVKYSVDGAQYEAEFVINALVYAEGALESAEHSAENKAAAKALVKYIEAVYKYVAKGNALPTKVAAKLSAFYAEYPAIDYITEYSEAEKCQVDIAAIAPYVDSIYFRISLGSRISLAVELKDEALAQGYTLKINGQDFDVINGNLYLTASASAYLALENPVCEIAVVDVEGNTVATTQYSMAAYIISMEAAGYDVEIAKALYTFAKATLELKNSIFN